MMPKKCDRDREKKSPLAEMPKGGKILSRGENGLKIDRPFLRVHKVEKEPKVTMYGTILL